MKTNNINSQDQSIYMLCFPPSINPDFIDDILIPDYPVSVFTTDAGVQWSTARSCTPHGAELTLRWDNTHLDECNSCTPVVVGQINKDQPCQVLEWWQVTRGTLLTFEVKESHPLWKLAPHLKDCFLESLPTNTWRFKERPNFSLGSIKNLTSFEVKLVQVLSC